MTRTCWCCSAIILAMTPSVKNPPKLWDIEVTKNALGTSGCQNILFVHAFLGCDTTSRIQIIGKPVALKKILKENLEFIQYAQVFNNPTASTIEVTTAGEKALLCLYKAGSADTLDSYRYKGFCEKASANTVHIQLKNIPPNSCYELP